MKGLRNCAMDVASTVACHRCLFARDRCCDWNVEIKSEACIEYYSRVPCRGALLRRFVRSLHLTQTYASLNMLTPPGGCRMALSQVRLGQSHRPQTGICGSQQSKACSDSMEFVFLPGSRHQERASSRQRM